MAFAVNVPKLQVTLDQAWRDSIVKGDLMAEVIALREHLRRQTATVEPIISGSGRTAKIITKAIYWVDACTPETEACSDECVAPSPTSDDSSKDVTITGCRQVEDGLSTKQFRTVPLQFDDVAAIKIQNMMKGLDEWLTAQFIAFLDANKGDHEYDLAGVWTDNAGDMQVPGPWDVDTIPQLILAARFARFGNPYILDGLNLWAQSYKAGIFEPNGEGKGDARMFSQFPFVFDPINMGLYAPGQTFLVNASAVALITGNYNPASPMEMAPGHRIFTLNSRNLPGIAYDVHEIQACASNDFVTTWQIRVNHEFLLNPLGCNATRTGILSFENVGV